MITKLCIAALAIVTAVFWGFRLVEWAEERWA